MRTASLDNVCMMINHHKITRNALRKDIWKHVRIDNYAKSTYACLNNLIQASNSIRVDGVYLNGHLIKDLFDQLRFVDLNKGDGILEQDATSLHDIKLSIKKYCHIDVPDKIIMMSDFLKASQGIMLPILEPLLKRYQYPSISVNSVRMSIQSEAEDIYLTFTLSITLNERTPQTLITCYQLKIYENSYCSLHQLNVDLPFEYAFNLDPSWCHAIKWHHHLLGSKKDNHLYISNIEQYYQSSKLYEHHTHQLSRNCQKQKKYVNTFVTSYHQQNLSFKIRNLNHKLKVTRRVFFSFILCTLLFAGAMYFTGGFALLALPLIVKSCSFTSALLMADSIICLSSSIASLCLWWRYSRKKNQLMHKMNTSKKHAYSKSKHAYIPRIAHKTNCSNNDQNVRSLSLPSCKKIRLKCVHI